MGKLVHHETVTTWVCDACGKQDIHTESSRDTTKKLPEGWVAAVIFDGIQPDVEWKPREPFGSGGEYWMIRERGDAKVSSRTWCHVCVKALRIVIGDSPNEVRADTQSRWFSRIIGTLKLNW